MRSIFQALLFLSISTLSFSCAKYSAQPLRKESGIRQSQADRPIFVSAHALTKEECKKYLGRNILKSGYQPIQITINNNTDQFLLLSKENIGLTAASPDEVAKRVETSTVGRVMAYGIPGLFVWPLIIPAVVDGVKSYKANDQLSVDYAQKTINTSEILPYSNVTGIIFSPLDRLPARFSIVLVNRDTREKHEFELQL